MRTNRLIHLYCAILAAALVTPSAKAEVQADALRQGIANYNAGNFAQATSFIQAHLAKNQNDATAHYYLANSLLKRGQNEAAISEYRRAYELAGTNNQLKQYCVSAIQNSTATAKAAPSPVVAGQKNDKDSDVAKALSRIDQQSSIAKNNGVAQTKNHVDMMLKRGNFDADKLQSECNARVNQLLQPDAIDIYGRPIYVDHTAEIEEVKRVYAERIKQAKIDATIDAAKHKDLASTATSKMLSGVDDLRSQLNETRHLPGTPSLQGVGTNLYNRQYGDPRASIVRREEPEPEELIATPHKIIVDPHSKPGSTKYRVVKDPLVAEQEKLRSDSSTNLKVKGTLIRK